MSEIHDTILKVLGYAGRPLAVHEMREDSRLKLFSENNICTRMSDAELSGAFIDGVRVGQKVWGATRIGKHYKEWYISPITDEQKREKMNVDGFLL